MADKDDHKKLPVESIDRFLEVQSREIDIREKELRLQEIELTQNHELALKSVDANDKFVNRLPDERRKDWLYRAGIFLVFVLVALGAIGYLFHINESELASDLLKVLFGAIFGATGGYGFGFHKGKTKGEESND